MNASSANTTLVIPQRDSFIEAVVKNVVVVILSISINYLNVSLIHTFCKYQIFYMNPRYILFVHLVINDMMIMTLSIIMLILSYAFHTINVSLCVLFVLLCLFASENTPLNLACMAVECYIAVSMPFRHTQICTVKRTVQLIGLIWMTSGISVLPDLFITLATQPLGFFQSRVFCLRETVLSNPHISKKREITYVACLIIVWLTIVYTYLRILLTAKTAHKDAKKARKTILLHGFQLLLCMATYVAPLLKSAMKTWLPDYYNDSLFALFLIIQILPRSISPIIYGVRDNTFRRYLKRHMLCQFKKQ